jgi:hypothetical protein
MSKFKMKKFLLPKTCRLKSQKKKRRRPNNRNSLRSRRLTFTISSCRRARLQAIQQLHPQRPEARGDQVLNPYSNNRPVQ